MKWLNLVLLSIATCLVAPAANAIPLTFSAHLTGPNEEPTNNSPGIGDATVTFDFDTHLMSVSASFSGLTTGTMAAHIHCCTAVPGAGTASVATQTPTFLNLPLGVTSGSFSQTLDMTLASSYNAPFLAANNGSTAAAELALFNGAANGRAYFNIHTTMFPGGEIRGFLVPVPEPATIGVLGLGLIGLYMVRRRTRS